MEKHVLTTAEAARLLGVSVRTAQLLIETGPLKSWKTPGGHRRVYLADVQSYMTQHLASADSARALAVLLVSPARRRLFDALLGEVGECAVVPCEDVYSAAFTIGARLPAAVIVDMHDEHAALLSFLDRITSLAELATTRFIAVAENNSVLARHELPPRVLATTSAELPGVLRAAFTPAEQGSLAAMVDQETLPFPLAANESERLLALQRSGLLNTPAEPAFDRLTWLASQHLGMPVSLMTLLSPTHQHFKSRVGIDLTETPRSWAICNHTILQRGVFSVPDMSRVAPFTENPAVVGPPHFRFYAGAPVFDAGGFALGSICVMDYEPHELNATQEHTLLTLAAVASDEVRTRRIGR